MNVVACVAVGHGEARCTAWQRRHPGRRQLWAATAVGDRDAGPEAGREEADPGRRGLPARERGGNRRPSRALLWSSTAL
jgi:hypothetical protein